VTLIVAGTFRVPPENLGPLRPHMLAVVEATRLEDGCVVYSYGEDVGNPGLIRVFEVWRDQACLDAHFASAHMKQWQVDRAGFGLHDRRIAAYDVAAERVL
jgi:quinol monooxygenase YgiN